MQLSIEEIAGKLGIPNPGNNVLINNLLIDSRSLQNPEGTLFFAIPTSGNDGHYYISQLYQKGVRNFVVNHIPKDMVSVTDVNWLIVNDTVGALQKIAARDNRFHKKILAITGSKGKTTLKEWIYQLLEPLENIARSPRSYNSQIGVPLSLWEAGPDTGLAIIEAGISRKGEMNNLAKCISPDTVIITNIGEAHNEGFASLNEKAFEKVSLAAYASVKNVIFNSDRTPINEAVLKLCKDKNLIGWSFINPNAPLYIEKNISSSGISSLTYTFKGTKDTIKEVILEDDSDAENAANALAFMLSEGYSAKIIEERFKQLHKIGTRLNVSEGVNGCSVILDSYTSDFSSLRPAIDFLRRRKTPGQTSTLILSDLHHETASADILYNDIADLIRNAGINRFIGVGSMLCNYKELFPANSLFYDTTAELTRSLTPSDFSNEIILLKGSTEFSFSDIAEMLETRKHETVLEVNLDSIISNYNYFRSKLPSSCGIVCMVKASGYGAGSYEIAKTLQDCGAAYLAVAVLDEGIELRAKGITMPIMVMNPKVVNYKSMFANRLEPEIYSFEMLRDVIMEAKKNGIKDYPVHIKLDTGMHRMGFIESELPELMDVLETNNEVTARSVFSHLATSDCPDMDDYTMLQLTRFRKYTDYMLSRSSHPIMRHILNSAGILRFPEFHFDMARLGIGLYGANTLPPDMEKPLAVVSTLRTVIIAIRVWEAGETIGYGRKGVLKRKSRIATIPIGYADGMNRHFGQGAVSVLVNGKPAPTVGNICMDACMIDVTGIECKEGDYVEIFGAAAPVQRLADVLDTIPYEILTSVSPRVKRIYYRE